MGKGNAAKREADVLEVPTQITQPAKITGAKKESRRRKLKLQGEAAELSEELRDRGRDGDSDYDPDEFLIPSRADGLLPGSNTDGASAKLTTTVMPEIARCVSIVIESKDFPYDTGADLVRHAVVEHLRRLAAFNPRVRSVMGQIQVMRRQMNEIEIQLRFDGLMDTTRQRLNQLSMAREQGLINDTLDDMQKAIEAMPVGRWKRRFREKYIKELEVFRKEEDE